MGGKLPKLPGSKDDEQWYEVQLVLGYSRCISGIHSFDTDGVEQHLQVAQNCKSGVFGSLQARVDILMEIHTTEQCPGRSLTTEQGTKQHKCFYATTLIVGLVFRRLKQTCQCPYQQL